MDGGQKMEHAAQAQGQQDDLVTLFEESFRNIEASRLSDSILKLCEAIAGNSAQEPQRD
jgi:hypothetical protein